MKKYKSVICIAVVLSLFTVIAVSAWLHTPVEFSDSERRKLALFPTLSLSSLSDGSFMTKFESYTQDQFPLRDSFRTLKAITAYYALGKLDNNDIYISDGYAAKLEYPLNTSSLEYATSRFKYVYENYLKDNNTNIYLSIVPDKSYFIAENNGYLSLDYNTLFDTVISEMSYAKYIDITGTLDITDYYKTDTHWRQEKLLDTAAVLASEMGVVLSGNYTEHTLDHPFYGVYYGQSALPLPAETIYYLSNDVLSDCVVINYENETVGGIYDMEKAYGKDPYELFLSGSISLLTIENPNANTDRELIIFRDSFGSSIAPLLVEGYSKITLVDIRYLRTDYLGRFIEFKDQDVLFLYSTLVLNNSETLT